MLYEKEGSEVFERRFDEKLESVPRILSTDFNFSFPDNRNIPVIDFLNEALGLTMSNDRKLSTAKQINNRCSFYTILS